MSAAGSGAVALARGSGVPMIALATDQPEQRKNLASAAGGWRAVVDLCARDRDVASQLRAALAHVPPSTNAVDCELAVRRNRQLWLSTLTTLTRKDRP